MRYLCSYTEDKDTKFYKALAKLVDDPIREAILKLIDDTCKHCWDSDDCCQCWNDD